MITPTDYRTWRTEAAGRDRAYRDGWRAGLAEAHRLRPHRLRGFAVGLLLVVLVLVGAAPLALVLLGILVAVREHRRSTTWAAAVVVGALYFVGAACALLAVVTLSVLPLVGTVGAVVAVKAEHRSAWSGRLTRWANGRGVHDTPRRGGPHPYRVTYTDKAHHIETRRYPDGSEWTVDTLTGEHLPGRF